MEIIYATDGSEAALAGASLLGKFLLGAGDTVRLLAVAPPGVDPGTVAPALDGAWKALGLEAPVHIRCRVREGHPAEEILREAEEHPADLIVVGTRGRSGIARLLLGSVAGRVAFHAPCSVLVARPLRAGLSRVVLGVDGSADSDRAARFLADLPLPAGCRVELITAVLPDAWVSSAAGHMLLSRLSDDVREVSARERIDAKARLDRLTALFRNRGIPCDVALRPGDAADVLLGAASEGADLIAVGGRGVPAVERFLIGSVSEKVLRHAACSVLVVRDRTQTCAASESVTAGGHP